MSSYQNPSEKLSALQKKLNGWKEELRDERQCIPNLIGLHDEYKSAAAYLQDKSGEIEDDFRALVQCRLKFEKSRTSPGLISVVLSYLLMPFCLGAYFINFFTKFKSSRLIRQLIRTIEYPSKNSSSSSSLTSVSTSSTHTSPPSYSVISLSKILVIFGKKNLRHAGVLRMLKTVKIPLIS